LAVPNDRDALSFTRLEDMIALTPGNLITHLRKLEDAGYFISEKSGNDVADRPHHPRAQTDRRRGWPTDHLAPRIPSYGVTIPPPPPPSVSIPFHGGTLTVRLPGTPPRITRR
jgi:hypothetical protein